jgi:hypothetical protein
MVGGHQLRSDMPNMSPEPTAVGSVSSAVAVHAAGRRWLSFLRWAEKMKYPIAIFLILVALTGGCKPKTDSTQWIDPNKISQGPVIHE